MLIFSDLTEVELDVGNLVDVRGLAVYADYLYWVDTKSRRVNRVNKMTGKGEQLVQGDIGEPTDVVVVDKHSFDCKLNSLHEDFTLNVFNFEIIFLEHVLSVQDL